MKRAGVADLPLHGGRVPPWVAARMGTLGTAIAESVIHHHGRPALLSRLSDPIESARLGRTDKLDGMARLDAFTRAIERRLAPESDAATIARERANSAPYGGRTVFDDVRRAGRAARPRGEQLALFDDRRPI